MFSRTSLFPRADRHWLPVSCRPGRILAALFPAALHLLAEGIPEPTLILYGEVRSSVDNHRVTHGTLEWTFLPAGGGEPVRVSTQLTNVLGQFSYALFVPCETQLTGLTGSPHTLLLSSANRSFDRVLVTVDGVAARLKAPASHQWVLSRRDRGGLERVDLLVAQGGTDTALPRCTKFSENHRAQALRRVLNKRPSLKTSS